MRSFVIPLAALVLCCALLLTGCSGSTAPTPAPLPAPTPTPTPEPTPEPTPTPAPEPPTLGLAVVGDAGCAAHPDPRYTCRVDFEATADRYDTITWSGCCEGSSGTTGSCLVTELGVNTCRAEAIGPGGSARASAEATGRNSGPDLRVRTWPTIDRCEQDVVVEFLIDDDQFSPDVPRDQRGSGRAEAIGQCTYVSDAVGAPSGGNNTGIWYVTVHVSTTGDWWENCTVNGTWTDPWGQQDSDGEGQFLLMVCP